MQNICTHFIHFGIHFRQIFQSGFSTTFVSNRRTFRYSWPLSMDQYHGHCLMFLGLILFQTCDKVTVYSVIIFTNFLSVLFVQFHIKHIQQIHSNTKTKVKRLNIKLYGSPEQVILELRGVTCHTGAHTHSVTCHLTQVNTPHHNLSQTRR